ncbi:sec1 family domain-containing protein 1-like [Actinia tenebrosa]|uniref:Sec1 family domain-containing protein 1-like n=1 Tax=Actinia tenebrosa TaxID=6105 RepID=A0A6P8HT79_ACTTE|nr:sec1 family domain-containing protein 1-like [Actinia tenebrosa]
MAASMRSRQIEALKRMLNLNQPVSKSVAAEPAWKVLVYDRYGQDIISPLLTVKDLRDMGVTLHLLLHTDRDPIPEVPAVYFVMPSEENVKRICQDCRNQLYESYYLNFITAITRQRLEEVATVAVQTNCVTQISKVYDQYLNFISLEDEMFTTRFQDRDSLSYYAINRPDAKDTDIENLRDSIVDSLFCLLASLGTVPIIRCPKGNAAEMVAEGLDKKLRENLRDSRNSLFTTDIPSGQISFHRPVLVILDRNMDLCTPLHHTWTYQALAHDVLDLHLNRVTVRETPPTVNEEHPDAHHRHPKQVKVKTYDLHTTDKFWATHKGSPFPTVAESIQKELDEYRQSEEEVKRLKHVMGMDNSNEEAMTELLNDSTAKLTSAVSSLPELLEKKKVIDMHTNIATALLDQIKTRKLDIYFETEEKIMSKTTLDKSILEIIQDPDAGSAEDKLRLFIIYFVSGPNMSPAEFDQYASALIAVGVDSAALSYIKKWKAFTKITTAPVQSGGGGQNTYSAMFSRIMSSGSQFVMEGVKNLVVGNKNLPVTRMLDALMDNKSNPEVEDFRYFDPKMLRVTDSMSIPRNKTPFQEAIVFMVGGGNFIEYQNLMDYSKRNSGTKKIIYGASEVINATQFLKQLTRLGQEAS